jgi:hypothetical protein
LFLVFTQVCQVYGSSRATSLGSIPEASQDIIEPPWLRISTFALAS